MKTYFEFHSFDEVIRIFRERFPGRNPPARMTIWRNVKKYTGHATNLNRNKGNPGRRFTVARKIRLMLSKLRFRTTPGV